MIGRIHHVGVVVDDLGAAIGRYRELGLEVVAQGRSEGEAMDFALLQSGTAEVELMQPLGTDTSMARFLTERGPGVHHIAYAVADLRQALSELTGRGFETAGEVRQGIHGSPVAFLHPRSVSGVLTELVQGE